MNENCELKSQQANFQSRLSYEQGLKESAENKIKEYMNGTLRKEIGEEIKRNQQELIGNNSRMIGLVTRGLVEAKQNIEIKHINWALLEKNYRIREKEKKNLETNWKYAVTFGSPNSWTIFGFYHR
jgi:hypothetical protein